MPSSINRVLFDLDGTLVNTAPDLVAALNQVLTTNNRPSVAFEAVSPYISTGAAGMIGFACPDINTVQRQRFVEQLVSYYKTHIAEHSHLFEGMETVLNSLEEQQIPWGIVTNKLSALTQPLVDALQLSSRTACVISGDTTTHSKPHPAPLLEACQRIDSKPANCVYIGDAAHDITAAQRAAMPSLAAAYGYLKASDDPALWGAHDIIQQPLELLSWLDDYNRTHS